MNLKYTTIYVFIICLTSFYSSFSQTTESIIQINNYCDSLDKLNDIKTVSRNGSGVTLDFIFSDGNVVKIIEHPAGYKFISATVNYYFRNSKPVFVNADIEISSEDGKTLTIELQKIHLVDIRIFKQMTSHQIFNTDSLYNSSSDPVNIAQTIRKNASYKPSPVKPEFEKILLKTIENYLSASFKKDDDPLFDELFSPFI